MIERFIDCIWSSVFSPHYSKSTPSRKLHVLEHFAEVAVEFAPLRAARNAYEERSDRRSLREDSTVPLRNDHSMRLGQRWENHVKDGA